MVDITREPMVSIISGIKNFWPSMFSVVIALTTSVLASIFGLLESTVGISPYLVVVAGFGLIYAVFFVSLLVGEMWGTIASTISFLERKQGIHK